PALEQVAQAVAAIDHFLDNGRAVAVHCGAGLGRTGTILACYLAAQGLSSDEALATVRAQQPGSVETPEQEAVSSCATRNTRRSRPVVDSALCNTSRRR